METLIFIAIAVVITIIQKKLEKAKEQQNQLPRHQEQRRENGDVDDDTQETNSPPRSLQDLIRQSETAQRQATQGNIEPPTPPVQRKHPEQLTLRDIAEAVIEVDFIDLEFLMEEFDVDENTAAEMRMDLQAHRSHEKRAELDRNENLRPADERENDEEDSARQRELERQRELNALEDRARSARESAATITEMGASAEASAEPAAAPNRPLVSTSNLADVRKGFIWAKVLDEPRFKRRWSTQYR